MRQLTSRWTMRLGTTARKEASGERISPTATVSTAQELPVPNRTLRLGAAAPVAGRVRDGHHSNSRHRSDLADPCLARRTRGDNPTRGSPPWRRVAIEVLCLRWLRAPGGSSSLGSSLQQRPGTARTARPRTRSPGAFARYAALISGGHDARVRRLSSARPRGLAGGDSFRVPARPGGCHRVRSSTGSRCRWAPHPNYGYATKAVVTLQEFARSALEFNRVSAWHLTPQSSVRKGHDQSGHADRRWCSQGD